MPAYRREGQKKSSFNLLLLAFDYKEDWQGPTGVTLGGLENETKRLLNRADAERGAGSESEHLKVGGVLHP